MFQVKTLHKNNHWDDLIIRKHNYINIGELGYLHTCTNKYKSKFDHGNSYAEYGLLYDFQCPYSKYYQLICSHMQWVRKLHKLI